MAADDSRHDNAARPPEDSGANLAEFTLRAVGLGVLVGVVMTAANVYLGLYAGMTVSASIPAAVISMGILRGVLRSGTILENNLVQTIGSAGESLAAGIIFTIPALVITGVWTDFRFWPTTLIAMLGGLLGVVFMIPIRKALIVEEKELVYPEGVACAEVLRAGEKGSTGVLYIAGALLVGLVVKFLSTGLGLVLSAIEGAIRVGRSAVYFGCDVSPALIAVGYIVGLNVASLVFLGGAIGWLIGIPVYYLFTEVPDATVVGSAAEPASLVEIMTHTWSTQIRFMGVGAMIMGGLWSIISVRHGIQSGVRGIVRAYQDRREGRVLERTDTDMPLSAIFAVFVPTVITVFVLYIILTGSTAIGLTAGLVMVVAAFFFVAVSSYIVGLVGSSNNPVSGMTISTVILACVLLTVFQMTGVQGIIASLCVAGVVCCAACTAGDVSQDLKTGHLVRATPFKQQWGQVIGVLSAAFIIAPVLSLLHGSYGVGIEVSPDRNFLPAPQAGLFASITRAFFLEGSDLPWTMIAIGAGIGILLIVCDEMLKRRGSKFRTYVMPVAVGIYLPWALGVPIFLGGIVAALSRRLAPAGQETPVMQRGVLLGSGLIAGEAFMGIIMAILIASLAPETLDAMQLDLAGGVRLVLSFVVLALLIAGIMLVSLRGRTTTTQGEDE